MTTRYRSTSLDCLRGRGCLVDGKILKRMVKDLQKLLEIPDGGKLKWKTAQFMG